MRRPIAPPGDRRQAGQVVVVFVFALVTLMAAAGLAVDIGRFYSERRFLQNAADAAALAAGNALARGGSTDEARTEALTVLTNNFSIPPNGLVPALPPAAGSEVYEAGHAGDPVHLIDGIVISGDSVRVAVRNTIPYTFGRAVGLNNSMIVAQARVRMRGNLLPVAVRRYQNAPGPSGGASSPCTLTPGRFADFLSTADTACLGSESDPSLRTPPSAGQPFDAAAPNNDPSHHGPIIEIVGLGASPANGADFRGFVALDVRDFENATSRQYFNGVTGGTDTNTLLAKEADYFRTGYPGPDFPVSTWPTLSYDSQVALMSGNASGISIDALDDRYAVGDEVMLLVYSGSVSAIPDFTVNPPGSVGINPTQTLASAGTMSVSRNTAFSGTVDVSVLPDTGNPNDPIVTGAITSVPAITLSPNPVTPSLGAGASVALQNITTSGATPGIYTLWVRGHSASPYLRTHIEPFALNVGGTTRDFTVSSSTKTRTSNSPGETLTWTISLSTGGGLNNFNGDVTLSLDGPLPPGLGPVTWSGTSTITLGAGPAANHTRVLSINTGTLAPGEWPLILRATGINGTGRPVTHLLELELRHQVAPPSVGYVDVLGFAVFRITSIESDTVWGYAITPSYQDPSDPGLRRGQVARLVPWN